MTPPVSLRLVGALYVSQYVGVGFLYFGLNGILRSQGTSLEQLAWVQALALIWVAKVLWAPVVDRFRLFAGGHYRSWLLVTQPLIAVALLALLPFDQPHLQLAQVIGLIAVYTVVSATQDIAVDAIVATHIEPERQGWANAAATIGSWVSNILGGGLILILYDHFGWQAAIIALTLMALAPLPMIAKFREPPVPARARLRSNYAEIGRALRLPHRRSWYLGVLPLMWAGSVAAYGLLTPALTDAGWSLSRIGLVMGMLTPIPATLGALLAGRLFAAVPLPRILPVLGGALFLASAALWPVVHAGSGIVVVLAGLFAYLLVMTTISTLVYSVHIGFARPGSAGSDFTTLTAIGTLWTTVGGYVAFMVAAQVGYFAAAMAAGALGLVGSLLAARVTARAMRDGALVTPHTPTPDAATAEPVTVGA